MDPVTEAPPAAPPAPPVDALDLEGVAAELAAVEAALGRLDEGRYGTCAACGGPIADETLAADPTTTTCAAHATPAVPSGSVPG